VAPCGTTPPPPALPEIGVEPTRFTALDPRSRVSTNFTIQAGCAGAEVSLAQPPVAFYAEGAQSETEPVACVPLQRGNKAPPARERSNTPDPFLLRWHEAEHPRMCLCLCLCLCAPAAASPPQIKAFFLIELSLSSSLSLLTLAL
jgi:hypothetical protein